MTMIYSYYGANCNAVKLITGLVIVLRLISSFPTGEATANNNKSCKATFIFGDSLMDAGNNNYLYTFSRADMAPNGIDFKASGGKPTGRFTNGKTIADILGEGLGIPKYALPFLDPNATGNTILYGVNYASGAGGILNATGRTFVNRIGMDVQIDYFNTTRKQIDNLLGASNARDYIRNKSLFTITIGSNDFINNYLVPYIYVGTRISDTPETFIDDMIFHFRDQLIRLYQLDARKFVVANVGPLGCIPYYRIKNELNDHECLDFADKLSRQYNDKLKVLLNQLGELLPEATFVQSNVYDLVMEIITNYKKYGFDSASKACCGNEPHFEGMLFFCGASSDLCENHDKYVFWDPYHPSEAANVLLAKQLLDGETKYISPMNVRQLCRL